MQKVRAIIFDLNGVFIQSPKLSERFRDDFGVDETVFLTALQSVMAQLRQPNAPSAYLAWQPYLEQWNVSMSEEEFLRFWFSAEKENTEMVAIAETLYQKDISLFILSNNLKERSYYYDQFFPFLKKYFKKVYYSWQSGYIKPNAMAYRLVLEENNLQPEECLYFDDAEKNISCAQSLGIASYIFTDAVDVRVKLAAHGLL